MQIATAILRNCTIKSGRPPFLDMTINFQGAVYHRAGQYINFYVLIVTWQHTYWSPTLITSPNITLWYWVSTSWQVAIKTYKSVCPALHAFRRCIVSCLQPVNTVVDHLLWLSRELSKFWENNPDHVIGVSQVLAYNVVYIYTHTHTRRVCATNFECGAWKMWVFIIRNERSTLYSWKCRTLAVPQH